MSRTKDKTNTMQEIIKNKKQHTGKPKTSEEQTNSYRN